MIKSTPKPISKKDVLRLVKQYMAIEDAYQDAIRRASCYPATIFERNRIKNELIQLINKELND